MDGGTHLEALRVLESQGAACLTAVADPFEHRLPELSARLRSAGVEWFPSHGEMFYSNCTMGHVPVQVLLTHAVEGKIPYAIRREQTLDIDWEQLARMAYGESTAQPVSPTWTS